MAKTIKLSKDEDINKVLERIKTMRERDVVFEIESGSAILASSANLKLMRKTAEVLSKTISIKTDDEVGRVLAVKAGVKLDGDPEVSLPKATKSKVMKGAMGGIRPKRLKSKTQEIEEEWDNVVIKVPGVPEQETKPTPIKPAPVKPAVKTVAPKVTPRPVSKPMVRPVAAKSVKPQPSMASKFSSAMPAMPSMPNLQSKPKWWKLKKDISRIFILSIVVIIIAVFGLAVLLPQAQITVYARSEPITRDLEISVDKNARSMDSEKLVIPGEIVTKELSNTKNFQTTGTKLVGEKATGSVVLYNFTKNTLTLRAATTTLVINGKNYFFTKDVTGLRPTATIGSGEDQEVDRSSLIAPVDVVAENPGDMYNLQANQKIEVKNTALGTTTQVYAINEVALTGGSSQTINILSQADLDRATVQMTDELAVLAEQELASDAGSKKVLASGSTKEILAKTANKNVGDEAIDFDMTIIGRLTGLAYSEDQVKELVIEKINAVLTEDKYLLDNGKKDVTATYRTIDLAGGKGVLSVHFETVAAYRVNDDNLAKVLAGKNAIEIKEILLLKPEIDRVDVQFSPFFVGKAPRFNGKIYIKTVLSQS